MRNVGYIAVSPSRLDSEAARVVIEPQTDRERAGFARQRAVPACRPPMRHENHIEAGATAPSARGPCADRATSARAATASATVAAHSPPPTWSARDLHVSLCLNGTPVRHLRLLTVHRVDAIDRPVERQHLAHAGGFRLRDQICLCEVQAVHLVDLERAKQRGPIDCLDRR